MKTTTVSAVLLGAAISVHAAPTVDETFPYTGPAVPIADWVDLTINGNGQGFPRLVEPPAVAPASSNPSNNINVIALSYIPQGINIHYQTPFGLGVAPSVQWGTSADSLGQLATGQTHTYDRTPSCAFVTVTECSQFFHEVQIPGLKSGTTYFYQIPAANGTTASGVLSFTTARAAGDSTEFTVAVLNDMGYTNAAGTYQQLLNAVDEGAAFAWHGGDISYADDWYSGVLPCQSGFPCSDGPDTTIPPGDTPPDYFNPLPAGEIANQGGPLGGDSSVIYESNWDLWQQWINNITMQVPYMVIPGNHEASCAEFDGPQFQLTALLNNNITNGTAPKDGLTYYSCPPSQRNFTAYQNRFYMPGEESGGVGNFWYSFDYGLAHFISLDGETDYFDSPEFPFVADLTGNETHPMEEQTFPTDSGPFGNINGSFKDTKNYEQFQWLAQDLASVDRTTTPWLIVMSHRPMYSSETASYQTHIRNAFEALLLQFGVDLYLSGHIHWYERLFPLGMSVIDTASIVNNNTYVTNPGVSITHIVNGMAGNIESHSTISTDEILNITVVLDQTHYGFSKLTVVNATTLQWSFVHGDDGSIGDEFTLLKKTVSTTSTTSSSSPTASGSTSSSSASSSTSSQSTTSSAGGVTTSPTASGSTSSSSASSSSSSQSTTLSAGGVTTSPTASGSTPSSPASLGASGQSSISSVGGATSGLVPASSAASQEAGTASTLQMSQNPAAPPTAVSQNSGNSNTGNTAIPEAPFNAPSIAPTLSESAGAGASTNPTAAAPAAPAQFTGGASTGRIGSASLVGVAGLLGLAAWIL